MFFPSSFASFPIQGSRVQGKAMNQRNALMFAWGEAIQTMDANQDASFEDAIKVREERKEEKRESNVRIFPEAKPFTSKSVQT